MLKVPYIKRIQPKLVANNLLSEPRDIREPIFFKDECEQVKKLVKEEFGAPMLENFGDVICIDSNYRVHDIVHEYGMIGYYYPYWFIEAQKQEMYHNVPKLPIEKHFSFLNGNPWPGRLRLLSRLYEENLLDDCFWTLNNIPQKDMLSKVEVSDEFLKLIPKSWTGNKFQNKSIVGFGDEGYKSIWDFNGRDIPLFRKSAVNVVIETDFYSNEKKDVFLTGKIAKTIAMKMPWILLCTNKGSSITIMESLGFKSFHDVWPELYGKCKTPETQIESVIETMRFILLLDKEEIIQETKEICNYNYEVLMNMKDDVLSVKDIVGYKK